jgi:hypothetical protein
MDQVFPPDDHAAHDGRSLERRAELRKPIAESASVEWLGPQRTPAGRASRLARMIIRPGGREVIGEMAVILEPSENVGRAIGV